MTTNPFHIRAISFLLLTSFWFTACDVPDISEFSKQSTEMTSGIRKEMKDTQAILQEQVDQISTYEKKNQAVVKRNLDEYKKAMKPSLQTLDSLDSYLEALDTLAQSNKKSGDNARAAVTAVSNLVSSAAALPIFPSGSAFKLGDSTVKIATGLLALEEQFRTAKSFKARVNLTAEIVEGRYVEVNKASVAKGETRSTTEFKKLCSASNKKDIENANEALAIKIAEIEKDPRSSKRAKESLVAASREVSEAQVRRFGCGVVDLLKFTLEDLRVINNNALPLMYSNYKQRNELTLGLYDGIVGNNTHVQNQIRFVLLYKQTIASLRDAYPSVKPPPDETEPVRRRLNNLMELDGALKANLLQTLDRCSQINCGPMRDFLRYSQDEFETRIYPRASLENWRHATALLESELDIKAATLFDQNAKYLGELERLQGRYDRATQELAAIKSKQAQMNKLLDASQDALDAWTEAHTNLRVSLNTKRPLTVARLARKVKEIWALFEAPRTQAKTRQEANHNGKS
jgi:hypothetical protein